MKKKIHDVKMWLHGNEHLQLSRSYACIPVSAFSPIHSTVFVLLIFSHFSNFWLCLLHEGISNIAG